MLLDRLSWGFRPLGAIDCEKCHDRSEIVKKREFLDGYCLEPKLPLAQPPLRLPTPELRLKKTNC
jgi:hypothetical protein